MLSYSIAEMKAFFSCFIITSLKNVEKCVIIILESILLERKAVIHREIPNDYKLKRAIVSQDPDGTYYCSLVYEFDKDIKTNVDMNKPIGLDYSSHDFYVGSDNPQTMLVIVANFIMVVSNSRFRFSSAIRFCSSNLAFCSSVKDVYHLSYKYLRYHEIASHWLMQYQCLRFNSAFHAIVILFLSVWYYSVYNYITDSVV